MIINSGQTHGHRVKWIESWVWKNYLNRIKVIRIIMLNRIICHGQTEYDKYDSQHSWIVSNDSKFDFNKKKNWNFEGTNLTTHLCGSRLKSDKFCIDLTHQNWYQRESNLTHNKHLNRVLTQDTTVENLRILFD